MKVKRDENQVHSQCRLCNLKGGVTHIVSECSTLAHIVSNKGGEPHFLGGK